MEEISRASGSVGLSYGAHSNLCINQLVIKRTIFQFVIIFRYYLFLTPFSFLFVGEEWKHCPETEILAKGSLLIYFQIIYSHYLQPWLIHMTNTWSRLLILLIQITALASKV